MGQTQSKRHSNTTSSTTNLGPPSPSTPSNITPPAPPRHLHHISELIDLDELFPNGQVPDSRSPTPSPQAHIPNASRHTIVQSPSGQELDAYTYLNRPDRPLTVQERQQRILDRLQQESRQESERKKETLRMMAAREAIAKRKKQRRACGGCWPW